MGMPTDDVIIWRMGLLQIKSLSILALKHLEPVKGEEMPDDAEFGDTLFSLLGAIHNVWERMENSYPEFLDYGSAYGKDKNRKRRD